MANLYTGPGKVYFGAKALWPQGEAGQITANVNQQADKVAAAMHGRVSATQGDGTATISLTPFDNWGALPVLFPAFLGVKVGATAAALSIGTRAHDVAGGGDTPAKIWTNDGRLYTFPAAAITKHPDLHLGVDKPLYGPIELTAIGAAAKLMGDAGFLYALASAQADPGGQMTLADFVRGRWTGVYEVLAGFGGDGGAVMEAEEEWTITSDVKYQAVSVQKQTRAMWLTSVEFMVKCRPYGPTQAQIDAAIALNNGRVLGSRFASGSAVDLVLTGPGAKTITLKNADAVGAGFEFGGSKLGNGEVGFINSMTFAGGVPASLIEFSA